MTTRCVRQETAWACAGKTSVCQRERNGGGRAGVSPHLCTPVAPCRSAARAVRGSCLLLGRAKKQKGISFSILKTNKSHAFVNKPKLKPNTNTNPPPLYHDPSSAHPSARVFPPELAPVAGSTARTAKTRAPGEPPRPDRRPRVCAAARECVSPRPPRWTPRARCGQARRRNA